MQDVHPSNQGKKTDFLQKSTCWIVPRTTTSNIEGGENGLLFLKMEEKSNLNF